MTFAGTAPQSTSSAVSSANSSSRIIARVPPMAASFASMGLMAATPTQQNYARIKAGRVNGGKSTINANIEGSRR